MSKLNTDKTELLWTRSRHSISQLHGHGHGPFIQLGADTVPACNYVRLLGVIISADLSLPCVHRQFGVLLLATTASTSSPITRRRIGSHTGSRLCYIQGRLLQSAVGRSTKVCYRQVAAGHECCSESCERHEEVRPRLDTPALLWAALARCGRLSHIQAWGDGVWPGLGVTVYSLHGQAPDYLSELCTPVAKLLNDSIFVPPAAIYSLFHGFSSIRTAVAPSLSLDQRHWTCSKTICVSRTCKLTVFVVHWRRVFFISTRHTERIRGAFCDDALYKLTFTFTLH